MNKRPIVVTISLLLSVMLALPSLAISAGRGGGGAHGGGMGHAGFGGRGGSMGAHGFGGGFASQHGFGQPFGHGRPFVNHGFGRFGRFFPFGAFAAPVVFWGSYGWPYGSYGWPYYSGSALYPDQSAYYDGAAYGPPVTYPAPASAPATVLSININGPAPVTPQPAVPPAIYEPPPAPFGSVAPAPSQNVVEYEGGRYELRGDGLTIAYRWVWIPNPPSGPPGATAMRAPASGDLAPARRGTIYHWVDDQGVLHVTDRWQAVPQRYREQAKQNLAS